ncbi:hypothetical protein PR048_009165 [Dryococelus australis]|uniref:Uncharacterized protein n=1 Tax=Dryococelus australis TaxID=614101 RepID=A0ABQ9HZ51_9NEOP|nr:hypothetical protein PR048_009165 [Dryococelus australis]
MRNIVSVGVFCKGKQSLFRASFDLATVEPSDYINAAISALFRCSFSRKIFAFKFTTRRHEKQIHSITTVMKESEVSAQLRRVVPGGDVQSLAPSAEVSCPQTAVHGKLKQHECSGEKSPSTKKLRMSSLSPMRSHGEKSPIMFDVIKPPSAEENTTDSPRFNCTVPSGASRMILFQVSCLMSVAEAPEITKPDIVKFAITSCTYNANCVGLTRLLSSYVASPRQVPHLLAQRLNAVVRLERHPCILIDLVGGSGSTAPILADQHARPADVRCGARQTHPNHSEGKPSQTATILSISYGTVGFDFRRQTKTKGKKPADAIRKMDYDDFLLFETATPQLSSHLGKCFAPSYCIPTPLRSYVSAVLFFYDQARNMPRSVDDLTAEIDHHRTHATFREGYVTCNCRLPVGQIEYEVAGDPRENPLTKDIVRHDSHFLKSGDPAGD